MLFTPLKKLFQKRLIIANKAPITGLGEGWWITPGTVEKIPQIKGMTAMCRSKTNSLDKI